MMKLRFAKNLAATALIWVLTYCTLATLPVANGKAVKFLMNWKNLAHCSLKLHRILVIGMSENPEIRADLEDDLSSATANDGLEAHPGNSILFRPPCAELDPDYLKGQIRDFKIDAMLVSRLVKVDKSTIYTTGHSYAVPYAYHRSFYGTVYRQVYSPSSLREATTVRVESNFYAAALPDGDVIWVGTSDSLNPNSAKKGIDGLVKVIVKELKKQSIL